MKGIIVDSNVWNSAFYERDDHRKKGKIFLNWMNKQKDIKVIINDYIISETLTFVRKKTKKNPSIAIKIINLFFQDPRIEIFYTSKENFNLAIDIYKKYGELSLVDSIIVLDYINIEPLCLISYDEGFDTYGRIIRFSDPRNIDYFS